jgi:hypothetical protein
MKRFPLITAVMLTRAAFSHAQYLETTLYGPPVHTANCQADPPGNPFISYPTFDVETINNDGYLDIATGQNLKECAVGGWWYGCQNYNNGSGTSFTHSEFFQAGTSSTFNDKEIANVVFGKLRVNVPQKDLAIPRLNRTEIYHNTGNGIQGPDPVQALDGQAVDASWGPFDLDDDLHDLAVTDGAGQIWIYKNLNNGTVTSSPFATFSIPATKIALTQMDENIYVTGHTTKWDLVSISGSTLSVRLNNNNGFGTPQHIDVGSLINSFAVGDINNDGFNDVVVATWSGDTRLYLNTTVGTLESTPRWSVQNPYLWPVIVIGDMGSPGDAGRNDGWNDLVIVARYSTVRLFINQRAGNYFLGTPQQELGPSSCAAPRKVVLADLQNTGGLSVIYALNPGWYIGDPPNYGAIALYRHTGNPAPAPPKNADWTPDGSHPRIRWNPNTERDLSAYKIYRKPFGMKFFTHVATVDASQSGWTDMSSSFCSGSNCLGYNQYYVVAVDNVNNTSDPSNIVLVPQNGAQSKLGSGKESIPIAYALHAASPNPFNPSTLIKFDLPEDSHVSLSVFDVLGRKVAQLVSDTYAAGYHSVSWDASGVASGVYFARFTAMDAHGNAKFIRVSKLLLAK